jgi:hypothetical protein
VLALAADRRLVGMPRQDARLVRSFMKTSMTAFRICSRSPPPTASLNSVSPVKIRSSTLKATMSSEWPGVASPRTRRSPNAHEPGSAITSTPKCRRTSSSFATWSWCACVRRSAATVAPHSSTADTSGAMSGPESTISAVPPSRSAIANAFESQPGCMVRSTSTRVG